MDRKTNGGAGFGRATAPVGIDENVPAGPLSVSVRVEIEANGNDPEKLREIVSWAHDHCPLCDLTKRAVPLKLQTKVV